MTMVKTKDHTSQNPQCFGIHINKYAGRIQSVRDGLTDDIQDLIRASNEKDARLMLRDLSETIAEITDRADRMSTCIKNLENLRDHIVDSIPEKLRG